MRKQNSTNDKTNDRNIVALQAQVFRTILLNVDNRNEFNQCMRLNSVVWAETEDLRRRIDEIDRLVFLLKEMKRLQKFIQKKIVPTLYHEKFLYPLAALNLLMSAGSTFTITCLSSICSEGFDDNNHPGLFFYLSYAYCYPNEYTYLYAPNNTGLYCKNGSGRYVAANQVNCSNYQDCGFVAEGASNLIEFNTMVSHLGLLNKALGGSFLAIFLISCVLFILYSPRVHFKYLSRESNKSKILNVVEHLTKFNELQINLINDMTESTVKGELIPLDAFSPKTILEALPAEMIKVKRLFVNEPPQILADKFQIAIEFNEFAESFIACIEKFVTELERNPLKNWQSLSVASREKLDKIVPPRHFTSSTTFFKNRKQKQETETTPLLNNTPDWKYMALN